MKKYKLIKKIKSITKDKTNGAPGEFPNGYRIALKEVRKQLVRTVKKLKI
jgi:hypothetical protein